MGGDEWGGMVGVVGAAWSILVAAVREVYESRRCPGWGRGKYGDGGGGCGGSGGDGVGGIWVAGQMICFLRAVRAGAEGGWRGRPYWGYGWKGNGNAAEGEEIQDRQ